VARKNAHQKNAISSQIYRDFSIKISGFKEKVTKLEKMPV